MTNTEQRELLTAIFNNSLEFLLSRSDRWPEHWDGLELRELAAMEMQRNRHNRSMGKQRVREFNNVVVVEDL